MSNASAKMESSLSKLRLRGAFNHDYSDGTVSVADMALINRGRLSVQRVEEKTWSVIEKLAGSGGWEDESVKKGRKEGTGETDKGKARPGRAAKTKAGAGDKDVEGGQSEDDKANDEGPKTSTARNSTRKRKAEDGGASNVQPLRRSTRSRK